MAAVQECGRVGFVITATAIICTITHTPTHPPSPPTCPSIHPSTPTLQTQPKTRTDTLASETTRRARRLLVESSDSAETLVDVLPGSRCPHHAEEFGRAVLSSLPPPSCAPSPTHLPIHPAHPPGPPCIHPRPPLHPPTLTGVLGVFAVADLHPYRPLLYQAH